MKIPMKFVEKAKFVSVIFTGVQEEYDGLLHLLTLGLDWTWRRRMLSKIYFHREMRILDLACGTGLLTTELSRSIGSLGLVVGLDLSKSMLEIAMRKKRVARIRSSLEFIRAAGEFMPFRNEVFEYTTVALALRNFGDESAMFSEAHRTLTNSGWLLSVDFVIPDKPRIRKLYMFHIFNILPTLGQLVSGTWRRTLTYLANSIEFSASPDETCRMLSRHGFRSTFSEKITLGVVALVGGQKRK